MRESTQSGRTADRFDESVQFDAPNPGGNWSPSPRQIREWGAIIKAENDAHDGLTNEAGQTDRPARPMCFGNYDGP